MNLTVYRALITFCISLPLAGFAQPHLNVNGNNRIGNVARMEDAAILGTHNGPAGAGQTWDFSSLTPISQADTSISKILRPADAPLSSSFPKADRVHTSGGSSFTYQLLRNDTLYTIGVADTASNLNMPYPRPIPFLVHNMTYGDSFVSTFSRSYQVMGYSYKGTVTSKVKADGYGTLKLPNGTYNNVLRIRYEEVSQDTFQADGSPLYSSIISYSWYDANHWSPLLSRDSLIIRSKYFNDDVRTIQYLINETLDVPEAAVPDNDLQVYENGGRLYLRTAKASATGGVFQAAVFTADGRQVSMQRISAVQTGQPCLIADMSQLPEGVYIIRCSGAMNGSVKFMRK